MTLWTIQDIEWYEKLLKEGSISGGRKYIEKDWEFGLFGYHWLMKKMDEKIGKRPFPECYPVWAWYQHESATKRKPDLRGSGFLQKGAKGVRLEIYKKEEDVLLSDFALWAFPHAFHCFIGQNEEESRAFDEMLEHEGVNHERIGKLSKKIQKEIIKSWDRVLDLDFDDPYHASYPRKEKAIQATFWTLSVNEIVKADYFIAR
jgi:hypothetical protein